MGWNCIPFTILALCNGKKFTMEALKEYKCFYVPYCLNKQFTTPLPKKENRPKNAKNVASVLFMFNRTRMKWMW